MHAPKTNSSNPTLSLVRARGNSTFPDVLLKWPRWLRLVSLALRRSRKLCLFYKIGYQNRLSPKSSILYLSGRDWVPHHTCIKGNEQANQVAKSAAESVRNMQMTLKFFYKETSKKSWMSEQSEMECINGMQNHQDHTQELQMKHPFLACTFT